MFFYLCGLGLLLSIFFMIFGQLLFNEESNIQELFIFDKKMRYNEDGLFDNLGGNEGVIGVVIIVVYLMITIPLLGLYFAPIQTICIALIFGMPILAYFIVRNLIEKREQGK